MDKWIKENRITTAIVLVLVVVFAIKTSLSTSDVNLQTKCASSAKTFYEQFTKDTLGSTSYTNHWNKVLNKCFVNILTTYPPYSVPGEGTSNKLFDAVEGKQYGYLMNTKTKELLDCFISKTGSGYNGYSNCQSENEFNTFVNDYMEN